MPAGFGHKLRPGMAPSRRSIQRSKHALGLEAFIVMTRNRICAALLVACGAITAFGVAGRPAAAAPRHSDPTCSLTAQSMGGADVVFIDAAGLSHGAWFQVDWVEPQITQVQYMWSTSAGVLQDSVMNDQGSGTYTATIWSLDRHGAPQSFQATCSVSV